MELSGCRYRTGAEARLRDIFRKLDACASPDASVTFTKSSTPFTAGGRGRRNDADDLVARRVRFSSTGAGAGAGKGRGKYGSPATALAPAAPVTPAVFDPSGGRGRTRAGKRAVDFGADYDDQEPDSTPSKKKPRVFTFSRAPGASTTARARPTIPTVPANLASFPFVGNAYSSVGPSASAGSPSYGKPSYGGGQLAPAGQYPIGGQSYIGQPVSTVSAVRPGPRVQPVFASSAFTGASYFPGETSFTGEPSFAGGPSFTGGPSASADYAFGPNASTSRSSRFARTTSADTIAPIANLPPAGFKAKAEEEGNEGPEADEHRAEDQQDAPGYGDVNNFTSEFEDAFYMIQYAKEKDGDDGSGYAV